MLSLIVAMDENGLIGRDNGLPWRLPNDLAFFKRTTMGKPIIMGRKTHESIGRPLPGRENIVITRQADYKAPGCTVVKSLEEAADLCRQMHEAVIMGGSQIYQQALPMVERMYITRVHDKFEGDAWFPQMDWNPWQRVKAEHVPPDERNAHAHSFEQWERVG